MSIPKYNELFRTVLECLEDGNEHSVKEITNYCSDAFHLTENERIQTLSSGTFVMANRVGWANAYLKKAGLIENTIRGILRITASGKSALNEKTIDINYLSQFDSFKKFKCPENKINKKEPEGNELSNEGCSALSPQEQLDEAISNMNTTLADELMDEIMKINYYDFEKLVIKLLIAMGYGFMKQNQNAVTKKSGDEGIDGILTADKFGFDSIYIQAKQWKEGSVVGRPEIQKFVGAMAGQGATKGLFITTAKFTKEAQDYAQKNLNSKIVLVDGEILTKLMIEFNIGVSTVQTYHVKKVDTDFFTDFS